MKRLLLFLIIPMMFACGGDSSSNPCDVDSDGDGYVTGTDCSAIDPAKIDCDDSNGNLWSSKADSSCAKSCLDEDKDGYFSQCDSYPTDSDGKELIDCDDSNQRAWTVENGKCAFPCSDNDNDGYYFKCEGEYPDNKEDCYDKNSTLWTIDPETGDCLNSCVDRDKDGYFTGCDAYPLDENNQPKIDCNDDDDLVHTPISETDLTCRSSCIDNDKDGYYINCERFDAAHPEDHCDGDPANWDANRCRYLDHENTIPNPDSTCVDKDEDGYHQSCNRYVDGLKGPDCNDSITPFGLHNHTGCLSCVDDDGDGLYVGCDSFSDTFQKDDNDHLNPYSEDYDLLIVANVDLIKELSPLLSTYKENHPDHKISIHYIEPGTVQELKALLQNEYEQYNIKGAWLIGDLPAAWYQKDIPGEDGLEYSEWPTDSYLGNFKDTWYDDDKDGIYDRHTSSRIKLDIYTARLQGDVKELTTYFNRVNRYHTEGPLLPGKAFMFIDDVEPSAFVYMSFFNVLKTIYNTFTWYTSKADTTKSKYISALTGGEGYEFVYQAIHASPNTLSISRDGEHDYQNLSMYEIDNLNPKGSFFTMLNCTASRFTEPNLATTNTHQHHALATFGCTQSLPAYDPTRFHTALKNGKSWGEAYREWYNNFEQYDGDFFENNFSGMMIMGDPLIVLQETTRKQLPEIKETPLTDAMKRKLTNEAVRQHRKIKDQLGTFEAYRRNNPHFFK